MNKVGFTLIELLIVVAIIGILAAIAVPNFLNAQMKAKIARVEAEQRSTATALEQYRLDWNTYVEDHDFPSTESEKGLFRLTSPIAYLSNLPVEPFVSKIVKNYSQDNPNYEFGSGRVGSCDDFPAHAFIIISPGPNLTEEVDRNDCFPNGTLIRLYDITNGLSSDGDIIRMGGEFNAGIITFIP